MQSGYRRKRRTEEANEEDEDERGRGGMAPDRGHPIMEKPGPQHHPKHSPELRHHERQGETQPVDRITGKDRGRGKKEGRPGHLPDCPRTEPL